MSSSAGFEVQACGVLACIPPVAEETTKHRDHGGSHRDKRPLMVHLGGQSVSWQRRPAGNQRQDAVCFPMGPPGAPSRLSDECYDGSTSERSTRLQKDPTGGLLCQCKRARPEILSRAQRRGNTCIRIGNRQILLCRNG